ncbi:Phosphatidylinositol 4-kinase gamma 4 [Ananas comosus]|uniref:1-phosphatidylinositol 4-kinase n=1 Tax=Ananas comosus TaxID=4615 RepID=A0A199UZ88_ANACO|nr:Phosphatidylinositol 4-kinase gamma 4 [Ananas comosus]
MSSAGVTLNPVGEDLFLFPFNSNDARSPHRSLDSIMIYLSIPGLSVIPMRVSESDSIASVKLRVQTCKGFVVKKQKLVFDGRELARNDCLIRDYGVSDGNLLHLVIRVSDLRVITVKTVCGKKFKFHVERGRTVAYVKKEITKKSKEVLNFDDQKLIFDGEELDDQRLIHDICKNNDAVIHLLVRRSAKVRSKPVDKEFELSIIAPDVHVTRKPPIRDVWIEPFIVNPKNGNPPILSSEGTGGAYFMQDVLGHKYIAVFKPIDEEPMAENNPRGLPLSANGEGLKRGTQVGEGAIREVAAYVLDHPIGGKKSLSGLDFGFSGVPPTAMVKCLHRAFNHPPGFDANEAKKDFKIGSLQMFVKNNGSCEDMGPRVFPVQEVHKICRGRRGRKPVLIPIDHGYCLPENFEDCTFEWLYWPQSRQPFNSETIDYIKSLNAEEDIELLRFYGWDLSHNCARTLRITTMLLKKGVERGLTPYDIGSILCRETIKKESKIEEILKEANEAAFLGFSEASFMETISEIMDRHLDELAI